MKVWTFHSTEAAYTAVRSCAAYEKGDVVLIASEAVIGIVDAWPIALTEAAGTFHGSDGPDVGSYLAVRGIDRNLRLAIRLATDLGCPLHADLAGKA